MFEYKEDLGIKSGIILGLYNLDKLYLDTLKISIEGQCQFNINFLELTEEILQIQKSKNIKKKISGELGLISQSWLDKMQEFLPGLIIQMIDISQYTAKSLSAETISEKILKEMSVIKNIYLSSQIIIIIRNINKIFGLEDHVRGYIFSKIKYIKEKNLFFFYNNSINNMNFINKFGITVKEELDEFYATKKKYYKTKFLNNQNNIQKEYSIKSLIKLSVLSFMTNIENINYSYLEQAYNILSNQLNKKNYMFCSSDPKAIYIELKNAGDFMILYLLTQKNLSKKIIIQIIMNHLIKFEFHNFFRDYFGKNNSNLVESMALIKKLKDIYLINLLWKQAWYNHLLIITKLKLNYYYKENFYIRNSIFINLLKLYIFLKNENGFIEEMKSKFSIQGSTFKKLKNKYLEKIPKYLEVEAENEENIIGRLSDQENLDLTIRNIILSDENLVNIDYIISNIKNILTRTGINHYDFYLLNKYELIEVFQKNNDEEISNNLYAFISNKDNKNKYISKFMNVFSDFYKKFNHRIISNSDQNINSFNSLENLIMYASLSSNNLSNKEIIKINELLSVNLEKNQININDINNNLFNFDIKYNVQEIEPLDIINANITISLLRNGINFNIHNVIFYFNGENNKNKINNQICVDKILSVENPISISINYLAQFSVNKCYIYYIQLILNNGVIINLNNTKTKNVVLVNRKSLVTEEDVIEIEYNKIDNKTDSISVGQSENHYYYLKYKNKLINKNIIIKQVKITINLSKENETMIQNDIYEFKNKNPNIPINSDSINQFILESDNINHEKENILEFYLQISQLGDYILSYNLFFTLVNDLCPDSYYTIKFQKKINIKCILPFNYSGEVQSPFFTVNSQNKTKVFPTNYPIKMNSYIENSLPEKIIIKDIKFIPIKEKIEINSQLENLFSKIKNYKLICDTNEKLLIPCIIKSEDHIFGLIGSMKIFWIANNIPLEDNNILNETEIHLRGLVINKFPLLIEGKYISNSNKYQLSIKNLESMSKIIKCSVNDNGENFFMCSKTEVNEILLPYKELIIQYIIYDKKMCYSKEENENDERFYKFKNLINLKEYYILDAKEKMDNKSLRSEFYYAPEIFKISS